jgi:hypothetical protein
MVVHNLRLLPLENTVLKRLGLKKLDAELVLRVVTAWALDREPDNFEDSERESILNGVPGYEKDSNSTEKLRKSIATVLQDKYKFNDGAESKGGAKSTCLSGTDIFGNLRVSQCFGKVALSTLVRPATAEWLNLEWGNLEQKNDKENEKARSRFAFLLMLFYSGSREAINLLSLAGGKPGDTAGDKAALEKYYNMRRRQLESDSWILHNCLYSLMGPAPGGGIDIKATFAMKAIVLLVRDLAVPINTLIAMIAIIASDQGWAQHVGRKLAVAGFVTTFVYILVVTFWNKVFPGTLAEWHILGETRISSLSQKITISSEMLRMYHRAGVATTFSGTVRRTATGPTSCWAPDTGEVGFHSADSVDLEDLRSWGLVGGYDKDLDGPIMLRNVYGRTTNVEVEVIEKLHRDEKLGTDFFHSYHMPSSGVIDKERAVPGMLGRCDIVSVPSSGPPA